MKMNSLFPSRPAKVILIILLMLSGFNENTYSQKTLLDLQEACQKAEQTYALNQNRDVLNRRYEMAVRTIRSAYLPQMGLSAQLSWQSEVTRVEIPLPGVEIPEMARDQYKAGLEVSQVIYEGGSSGLLQQAEKAAHEGRMMETEAELFRLRQRVDALFFNVLMLRKQVHILSLQLESIDSRFRQCQSAQIHGAALPSQCDELEAGKLAVAQSLHETHNGIRAGLDALGLYCGMELSDSTELSIPDMVGPGTVQVHNRPEIRRFEATLSQLNINRKLTQTKALPKVSGFAQAGYGRPGLNMLDSDFKGYFLAGIRLSMPVWTWNRIQSEASVIESSARTVELQNRTFHQELDIRLSQLAHEAEKYSGLEAGDREIVRLRSNIARTAGIQYDEGMLMAGDWVQYLNEEAQARMVLEQHLLRAKFARLQWARESGQF